MTHSAEESPKDGGAEGAKDEKLRRFQEYFITWEDGRPTVQELMLIGRGTRDERRVPFATSIVLPESVIDVIREDYDLGQVIMRFATTIGIEHTDSVKVKISCAPGTSGSVGVIGLLKHKLRGMVRTCVVEVDDIPQEVIDVARLDQKYQIHPVYLRWYWPYTAKHRNKLISAEIEKQYGVPRAQV